ncbi:MAG TPA: cytochrome c maturation protein CcmE [Firmicutes bacterium]|nr:cytochrome c maturation protein CcmE [Bacillota bacterium]
MKLKFLWMGLIVIAAVAYFLYTGWQGAALYYLTVGEAYQRLPDLQGKTFRLTGTVDGSSIRWEEEAGRLQFRMTDGEWSIPVRYQGPRPDNFGAGQQVVVEGQLDAGGSMTAARLIVKCPSKYEQGSGTGQAGQGRTWWYVGLTGVALVAVVLVAGRRIGLR